MRTVNEVRDGLLELSRAGDAIRGGDWCDVEAWHGEVVDYVRDTLGDAAADDVALRLRCKRGATQTEKEANAVGFVADWIGTQVVGLNEAMIRQPVEVVAVEFEPIVAIDEPVSEPEPAPEPLVEVAAELEIEDGDAGTEVEPE